MQGASLSGRQIYVCAVGRCPWWQVQTSDLHANTKSPAGVLQENNPDATCMSRCRLEYLLTVSPPSQRAPSVNSPTFRTPSSCVMVLFNTW